MLAIVSLLAVLGAVPAAAVASSTPSNFLLVSGVTAADENCLVGAETGVWLDSCQTAVADLSGREIWSLASDGSLVQAGSKQRLVSARQAPAPLWSCCRVTRLAECPSGSCKRMARSRWPGALCA